jgi:hypothetical protein
MARVAITVMGFRCERCAHEWVTRRREATQPRICPKCKSAYWDRLKVPRAGITQTAEAVPAQEISPRTINCPRPASDETPEWFANLMRTSR